MTHIDKLLEIMAALRDPQGGCPWDLEQDFRSIAPYTIEEAYEVADAIARDDLGALRDELGDLLLQVVFHARMAEERGAFAFPDVVHAIVDKLIRRHPHVFGAEAARGDADEQLVRWEDIKARERATQGTGGGALDGVVMAAPALLRAQKLGKRAARVGFDWESVAGVQRKLAEELGELDAARSQAEVHSELGDVLFTVTQLARHLGVDAEHAARDAADRFEARFRHMERSLGSLDGATAETLETAWEAAKRALDSGA